MQVCDEPLQVRAAAAQLLNARAPLAKQKVLSHYTPHVFRLSKIIEAPGTLMWVIAIDLYYSKFKAKNFKNMY